jgi:ribonuclease Z
VPSAAGTPPDILSRLIAHELSRAQGWQVIIENKPGAMQTLGANDVLMIEAGDCKLLIDAGRGATIRLCQLGISLGLIDALLITHYHSDHVSGVPDLWLTGWLGGRFAGRKHPFRVIGPAGAHTLMQNLGRAYSLDIAIRIADEKLLPGAVNTDVAEFCADGVIYEEKGVKVITFEVDHGPAIRPAYGYRIEHGGRVAVVSGDTRFNENLIKHSGGADLIVHEVAMAHDDLKSDLSAVRVLAHHTTPQEAGQVFARTKPKLAVYSHLVYLTSELASPIPVADFFAATRATYEGPLRCGEDLMAFEIRSSGVICKAGNAGAVLA